MLATSANAASYVNMLVMTRGIGDTIMIGDNIAVTVVRIVGGVVRIGIEAPSEAVIMRTEMIESSPAAAKEMDRNNDRPK
jgi:carbon storage regulator